MKIQLITHGRKHYNDTKKFGAWHSIAFHLDRAGHDIDFILKKDWLKIYFRYLKFKPDVIVVTGIIGYFVMKLKKLGLIRCPIVLGWNDYFTEQMGKKWGISRVAKMEYYMMENADYITTPSKYLEVVSKILNRKCTYVPHGVDEKIYDTEDIKLEGDLKIVYSGEISEYKKVDKLIEAAKKNSNVSLYLMGDVADNNILADCPKNIKHLGFLAPRETFKYVKAADICTITSDQDSTLKMPEYLALGKPILALNGRSAYVLKHKTNAYLTDDFIDGINELSSDKKLLNTLSLNAKKYKIYTWKEISSKIEKILQNVISKGNK